MQRAAPEYQSLPSRGSFAPSAFVRPGGQRQFVPMTPGRSAFVSGVPVAAPRIESAPMEAAAPAEAPEVHAAPVARAPSAGREAELEARIAELEATVVEQRRQHDEVLRLAHAEHQMALASANAAEAAAASNSQRFGRMIGELGHLRERAAAELRAEAGEIILTAARRLAGRALQVSPGVLEELVNECVEALGGRALIVRVNPEDVERVAAAVSGGVRVVPDASVHAGCIAEGEGTRVEATMSGGLSTLADELAAWRRTG